MAMDARADARAELLLEPRCALSRQTQRIASVDARAWVLNTDAGSIADERALRARASRIVIGAVGE